VNRPLSARLFPLRRLAARFAGNGPWRIAPFAELATDEKFFLRHGVYGTDATGTLVEQPGDSVRYQPPLSLLGQILPESRDGYRFDAIAPPRAKSLFVLRDAGVMGSQGLVYCRRSRSAVAETAGQWHEPAADHPLLGTVRFPEPRALPGLSCTLLARSSESFYHFLHEALPKLHLLGKLAADVDHFVVDEKAAPFARAWLEHAGVTPEKIVWAPPLAHFACEQLLFTSDLCFHQQPTRWNLDAVRQTVRWRPPATRGRRIVWISRPGAYARQFAWENDLVGALPQIELHDFSRLSPAEQLALCAETAVLMGPHGAGFSHIAFCAPGTVQVELFPSATIEPLYSRWAQLAEARPYWARVDFSTPRELPALAGALKPLLAAASDRSET